MTEGLDPARRRPLGARAISDTVRRIHAFFLPFRRSIPFSAFATVVVLGALLGLLPLALEPLQRLEWAVYDVFLRGSASRRAPPSDIVVVAIDELSFQEIGLPWPWPRSLHGALIAALRDAGARAIVLDIVFDQRGDPFDDEILADSIRGAGNVILASDIVTVDDPQYSVQKVIGSFPELREAAAGVGIARMGLDPDGVVRRAPIAVDGRPGLALAALGVSDPGFGHSVAATSAGSPRLLRYRGPPRHGIRTVSYYQALDPAAYLPRGLLQDAVVFVGFSLAAATEIEQATDHYMTPFASMMAGVEIHANVLDNLMRDSFVRDPFASKTATAAFSLTMAILVGFSLYRIRPLTGFLVVLASFCAVLFGSYGALEGANLRIPAVAPVVHIAAVFLVILVYRTVYGINERRQIVGAFKHYLAPAIVEQILDDPSQLKLGGSEYDATILFSDLAGFTTLSEILSPSEVTGILSEYLEEMMAVLQAKGATLDKFIGDAIMVYFGCPVVNYDHPQQACEAAHLMHRRLSDFNREQRSRNLPPLSMRIGINTGTVVAGNMGTESIFNFTVIGDTVNLAARLEGINKYYGTRTLISEYTARRLSDDMVVRELDRITVKGKSESVGLYELVAFRAEMPKGTQQLLDGYSDALRLYRRRDWEAAVAKLSEILEAFDDPPSRTLLERSERYRMEPPAEEWAGVYVFESK